jgi:hypothetical protein
MLPDRETPARLSALPDALPTTLVVGTTIAGAMAGGLGAVVAHATLPAVCALVFFLAIVIRPEFGAYLYLALAPLLVGIGRDTLLPALRPSEGLLLLILVAGGVHAIAGRVFGREWWRPSVGPLDVALVLLALSGSVIPLLFRVGRGLHVSTEDFIFALVIWKYIFLFAFFRFAVSTPSQVGTCLMVAMSSGFLVAMIAAFQVLGLFGVSTFLHTYYDQPFEGYTDEVTERGTSTIASSFGMSDIMVMCLAIAMGTLAGAPKAFKPVLLAAAAVFASGCIVSGQFSAVIGLVVSLVILTSLSTYPRRALQGLAAAALFGTIIFWPVIAARLGDFHVSAGLPSSWIGRLDNLRQFILPALLSDMNWVTGVRTDPRVPAPEPWREWVYIESGYIWIVWTGGMPMLAAFGNFVWASSRELAAKIRAHAMPDPPCVAAIAALVGLATIATLMLFDPHLTMRGTADLFFPLLAMSLVGPLGCRSSRVEIGTSPSRCGGPSSDGQIVPRGAIHRCANYPSRAAGELTQLPRQGSDDALYG